MKLKKIAQRERAERLSLSVKQSSYQLFAAYRKQYQHVHGEPIEISLLLETILLDYIDSDKEFQKVKTQRLAEAEADAASEKRNGGNAASARAE